MHSWLRSDVCAFQIAMVGLSKSIEFVYVGASVFALVRACILCTSLFILSIFIYNLAQMSAVSSFCPVSLHAPLCWSFVGLATSERASFSVIRVAC